METKKYYVYILTKARNSTFYVGVTSNLIGRVWQHREGVADGFTKKYGINRLVYYEVHEDVNLAIIREKLIKKWRREIKLQAIEKMNPDWNDLYTLLVEDKPDPVMRRGDKR
jgi:putative endonuclease